MKIIFIILCNFLFFLVPLSSMKQDLIGQLYGEEIGLFIKNSGVSQEEKAYLSEKDDSIRSAFKKFLKQDFPDNSRLPKIGFALSGGGYRAMIAAAGSLLGAEEAGYLKCASYTAGVSGSTWLQAFLHVRNQKPSSCISLLKERVRQPFFDPETLNYDQIVEMLESLHKESHIEFVDVWGALIVERLFGDLPENPLELTFGDIRKNLEKSQLLPFPIFSTVIPVENEYEFGEVNPWRGGSAYLQGFTTMPFFGSRFQNGFLEKKAPESSLPFLLGLFGSAYSISLYECLQYINNGVLREVLKDIFDRIPTITEKHFAPATMPNFMYQLKGPYADFQDVSWIDAGHDINVGVPSLLDPERAVDIIIVCDASSDASVNEYPELKKAALWAQKHKRPFPDVSSPVGVKDDIAYFCDFNNPKVPVVIYLANPCSDSTLKFEYDSKDFDNLCNANSGVAKKASEFIRWALEMKSQQLNSFEDLKFQAIF